MVVKLPLLWACSQTLLRAPTAKEASKPPELASISRCQRLKDFLPNVSHQLPDLWSPQRNRKEGINGLDKLGVLPLSPRDGTFPPSGELPTSSFRAVKGAIQIMVEEKTQ